MYAFDAMRAAECCLVGSALYSPSNCSNIRALREEIEKVNPAG